MHNNLKRGKLLVKILSLKTNSFAFSGRKHALFWLAIIITGSAESSFRRHRRGWYFLARTVKERQRDDFWLHQTRGSSSTGSSSIYLLAPSLQDSSRGMYDISNRCKQSFLTLWSFSGCPISGLSAALLSLLTDFSSWKAILDLFLTRLYHNTHKILFHLVKPQGLGNNQATSCIFQAGMLRDTLMDHM